MCEQMHYRDPKCMNCLFPQISAFFELLGANGVEPVDSSSHQLRNMGKSYSQNFRQIEEGSENVTRNICSENRERERKNF